MENRNAAPGQVRGNNERHGGVPYNRLAEDMAQSLADLQVPGVDNGSGGSENGRIENETESLPGPREPRQGRHRGERRTAYHQLAADMAVPLAELQVPGASNVGETSSDKQVKSEMGDRGDVASVDKRETKRRGRNHYFELAADMAGALAQVRAPAISDERSLQPDHQVTESAPLQESFSEYNPDASCGSGYDSVSCRHSSALLDARSEIETEACQGEDMESVAVQESFSEYNENASCGSGFYRSEYSISDYQSSVQTSECESFNQRSFAADSGGFRSKSPSEIDTAQEECHSRVDGEPFSKRTKPNPEVTEELSLPRSGLSYAESTTTKDVQFESVAEVCPADSKLTESLPVQGEKKITQNIKERARNDVSTIEPRLTSEFEHMNLVDNNSVETGASFDSSAERSIPGSHSDQEVYVHKGNLEWLKKDDDRYAVRKSTDSSAVGNDFASYSTNADGENVSSFLSQGARPKTRPNVPREKKHKTPKQNTKNAYTELAKVVAGDLAATNSQIDDSHAKTRRADDEKKRVRQQELFDGSTVGTAASDATSLHAARFEREQRDTLLQPSLTNEDETKGNDVQDQGGNSSSEISGSRATSRRKLDAAAAAEHRSQVEEQQRLVDNMAPQLQSMVIEMIQRDEQERGRHILLNMPLNPPVPRRSSPQGRGGNVNQGACAEGTLNQAKGKKSRKGPKRKGHYVELADIIAPQLAAVNAAMVNGHTKGELAAAGDKKTVGNQPENPESPRGITGSADEETLVPEPEASPMDTTGARKTDTRSRDHLLSNGCAATSSRHQSRAHVPLPLAASGRETTDGHGAFSMVDSVRTLSQRHENGNRSKYH